MKFISEWLENSLNKKKLMLVTMLFFFFAMWCFIEIKAYHVIPFLAQMFSEKTQGIAVCVFVVVVMQKLYFVKSLPLLNIYTWNSENSNLYYQGGDP